MPLSWRSGDTGTARSPHASTGLQSPAPAPAGNHRDLELMAELRAAGWGWQLDLSLCTQTLRLLLHNERDRQRICRHVMFLTVLLCSPCELERTQYFIGKQKNQTTFQKKKKPQHLTAFCKPNCLHCCRNILAWHALFLQREDILKVRVQARGRG